MGFAWILSLVLNGWVSFVLGRKYQDMQDIMLARRVAKLIEQRKKVAQGSEEWTEIEEQIVPVPANVPGQKTAVRRVFRK